MHDKFKVVQIIVCTVVNIFLFIFEYSTLFVDYKQHFFMKPLPYLKIAVGLIRCWQRKARKKNHKPNLANRWPYSNKIGGLITLKSYNIGAYTMIL